MSFIKSINTCLHTYQPRTTNRSISAPFPLSAAHSPDSVVNKGHLTQSISHAALIACIHIIHKSDTELVAQILLQRALWPNKLYISTIPAHKVSIPAIMAH